MGSLLFALALGISSGVQAESAKSDNYQATDLQLGEMNNQACNDEVCAETALGGVYITDSSNDVMTAQFDPLGDDDESRLELILGSGASSLGKLSTDKTATKVMIVKIRVAQTNGFTVQVFGKPPHFGEHVLPALKTSQPAEPGKEQFGINVVKNTEPKLGFDPKLLGSDDDMIGDILPGYNLPNLFRYQEQDTIIKSQIGDGRLDYAVSMMMNISSDTPPGNYVGQYTALVVPTY